MPEASDFLDNMPADPDPMDWRESAQLLQGQLAQITDVLQKHQARLNGLQELVSDRRIEAIHGAPEGLEIVGQVIDLGSFLQKVGHQAVDAGQTVSGTQQLLEAISAPVAKPGLSLSLPLLWPGRALQIEFDTGGISLSINLS